MPDSNITKKALAAALKELMEDIPFTKISVGLICEKCSMNRKSFYYHFKDKYDLVNWIYYTEFIEAARGKDYQTSWEFLSDICHYFEANKHFYRNVLKVKGQNCFSDYFWELLLPIIGEYLKEIFSEGDVQEFYIDFFADAFTTSIERWLLQKDSMPADKFVSLLKSCVQGTARKVICELTEEEKQKEDIPQ